MNEDELMQKVWYHIGRMIAQDLQARAPDMTPTEVIAEEEFLPMFDASRQYLNFDPGYICKTAQGNIVKLLQSYDSTIYTQQPENLQAQWGFYWSTDPIKARPFLKLSTSPYYKDSCCVYSDHIWRSKIDNNVWSPSEYPQGWEDLGPS